MPAWLFRPMQLAKMFPCIENPCSNGQFQVRIKASDGTRLERTEEKLRRVLQLDFFL
jgi:hypothetical protein